MANNLALTHADYFLLKFDIRDLTLCAGLRYVVIRALSYLPSILQGAGSNLVSFLLQCDASPEITAFDCNCECSLRSCNEQVSVQVCCLPEPRHTCSNCAGSICVMKQNVHFMVPAEHFRLVQGEKELTTYQFNTKTAKHLFCR